MATPSNVSWDHAGHLHTNALHWEGFPHLLWESLSLFHYTEPPQYDGVDYREEGVPRCRVRMMIPQHPFHSQWHPIEVDVGGIVWLIPSRLLLWRLSIYSTTSIQWRLPGIPLVCSVL
jgi:hypothetical protein